MEPCDFYNKSKRKIKGGSSDSEFKSVLRSGTIYGSNGGCASRKKMNKEQNIDNAVNNELLVISSDEENPLLYHERLQFKSENTTNPDHHLNTSEDIYEIESVNSSLNEGKCIMKLQAKMIAIGSKTNSNDSDLLIYAHSLSFKFYIEGKLKKYTAIELTVNFDDLLEAFFVHSKEEYVLLFHVNNDTVEKYERFLDNQKIFQPDYPFNGILFELHASNIHDNLTSLYNYVKNSGCDMFNSFGLNQRVYILRTFIDYRWPLLPINICRSIITESSEVIILSYPIGDKLSKSISITISDFVTLQPSRFLNDTIVEFYLYYILYGIIPIDVRKYVHIFSTYFYEKIKSKDSYSKKLLNWTSNINIIEKKYIILPVNKELHWSLFIICFIGQLKDQHEFITIDEHERPCIIALDSLKTFKDTDAVFKDIRQYLSWVLKEKSSEYNVQVTSENMPGIVPKVLKQQNTSDCGIFLLQFTESFLNNVHDPIPQDDYTHLFNIDIINEKRKTISRLITSLASSNIKNQKQKK